MTIEPPAVIELRLYVSARSVRSARAIEIGRLLDDRLRARGGRCDILDVGDHADLAAEDRILATPTLVRRSPEPPVRVIGDVSDMTGLAARLGLPRDIMDDEETTTG
jgi:circadian clock protein KaiB